MSVRKDLSRTAVERAQGHMKRALAIFGERIPLGPQRVGVSQARLRQMYHGWSPEQRELWVQQVGGYEVAGEMLDGTAA